MGRSGFVPALGRWRSVAFYERLMRAFSLDDLPGRIAEDIACGPGARILDLGCGPGSLERAILAREARARPIGVDPDLSMLRHAGGQTTAGAVWIAALAQRLPFADETFDAVAATLLLHHLTPDEKRRALAEARRVLRPGGGLWVTDWTAPRGAAAAGFWIVRLVDGLERTADHAAGRLDGFIEEAGFGKPEPLRRRELALGTITHYRAAKPAPQGPAGWGLPKPPTALPDPSRRTPPPRPRSAASKAPARSHAAPTEASDRGPSPASRD